MQLTQHPAPGTHRVMFRGDTVTFSLAFSEPLSGDAWLRTNIGYAAVARKNVINEVVRDIPSLGTEWYDIPMTRVDDRHCRITLPLTEVGHFEAKCLVMPSGEPLPLWPEGDNVTINVEPAETCCGNIVYNAFIRQFGPNKAGNAWPDPATAWCIDDLDEKQYTVIPPSGTFRDLITELDFIVGRLGCRIIQLLPIHPTPTTFARMGRFGSPYAALRFMGVDPSLAVFDKKATPLEQFTELVDAVHARHARLMLDIAINHTGWASRLHEIHPEWLVRDDEGEIQVPGAWGIQWEDLTSLDHSRQDLWQYIGDVFLTWCRRGVDGFRCDAGYMIPARAWRYIVARVREQFPDTLFFLEGLGGKISVTRDLLNRSNLNWAYSELFQNYDRGQIEHYLPTAMEISEQDGIMVHFSETHDNNRLAARSKPYARMRTALCALMSHQGGFGFANGVEWFAAEKIDVHGSPSLNWGAEDNQVDYIRRLNLILRRHPAFFDDVILDMIQTGAGNGIVMLRRHRPSGSAMLVVVNLDDDRQNTVSWALPADMDAADMDDSYVDLLTGEEVRVKTEGNIQSRDLSPGQVYCLTRDRTELELFKNVGNLAYPPSRAVHQRARAKVLDVFSVFNGMRDVAHLDVDTAARQLCDNPGAFCRSCNPRGTEPRVISWRWPEDVRRTVMVPPDHFLLVTADAHFRAAVVGPDEAAFYVIAAEDSLPGKDNTWFVLFAPCADPSAVRHLKLQITVYEGNGLRHEAAPLLFLPDAENAVFKTFFNRHEIAETTHMVLGTNGAGGMLRANALWGRLKSKYDALLAANLNPDFPEDRQVMLTRCRAWMVYQGYSQEISFDCLDTFRVSGGAGVWRYRIPTGQGGRIGLVIRAAMVPGQNAMIMTFYREPSNEDDRALNDAAEVQLILRPDIEDRNFHHTTKAYAGPEHAWPAAVEPQADGFVFAPDPARQLRITVPESRYVPEPEWYYMVPRPLEAERGMDDASDLFSPGYFSLFLRGGQTAALTATVNNAPVGTERETTASAVDNGEASAAPFENTLHANLAAYVVRRGQLKSVIAGYPWFLDWGRDSLIVARGLVAAGMTDTAKSVLMQFGRFEDGGTLPNMIHGDDAGNRDTSDAPLWFFTACADILKAEESRDFLDAACGGRTIQDILLSIAHAYIRGTANGIYVDAASGLVFSPAHFTWMDTDHPAGTPRQGYCIEIQALWHAALSLLVSIDPENRSEWEGRANQVEQAIYDRFLRDEGYLGDCIHAHPGESARKGALDDALRPNQLLAVTLGAVKDPSVCDAILGACECLLVPGAIRSLADRPVTCPIAVFHNGQALNDPYAPYQGRYAGDEDTCRKPAYHNGTAWTWMFPLYCEAWAMVYGDSGRPAARSLLASSMMLMEGGCTGHLPEILDGDAPHTHRGCDAQAWGLSEFIRVWEILKS
ncbi:MAG: amylo-alpha-1,6-glucosidase [Thermodesulfobacteriota bacterium]|nr:amylo-alpha-1,6-glucosidase [Thermodesulfobacteriota bacterium]